MRILILGNGADASIRDSPEFDLLIRLNAFDDEAFGVSWPKPDVHVYTIEVAEQLRARGKRNIIFFPEGSNARKLSEAQSPERDVELVFRVPTSLGDEFRSFAPGKNPLTGTFAVAWALQEYPNAQIFLHGFSLRVTKEWITSSRSLGFLGSSHSHDVDASWIRKGLIRRRLKLWLYPNSTLENLAQTKVTVISHQPRTALSGVSVAFNIIFSDLEESQIKYFSTIQLPQLSYEEIGHPLESVLLINGSNALRESEARKLLAHWLQAGGRVGVIWHENIQDSRQNADFWLSSPELSMFLRSPDTFFIVPSKMTKATLMALFSLPKERVRVAEVTTDSVNVESPMSAKEVGEVQTIRAIASFHRLDDKSKRFDSLLDLGEKLRGMGVPLKITVLTRDTGRQGLPDWITLEGMTQNVGEVIARHDLALVTSESESFSLFASECMQQGLGTFVLNTAGISEYLDNYFVADNVENLAKKVTIFLESTEKIELRVPRMIACGERLLNEKAASDFLGNLRVFEPPLVSVIIPSAGELHYIQDCIGSLLGQTYTAFEAIFAINGEIRHETQEYFNFLSSIDSRFKPHFRDKLSGAGRNAISPHLNFAISASNGKYLARLDDDDMCLPDRIESQVNLMESRPAVDLVASEAMLVDSSLEPLGRTFGTANTELASLLTGLFRSPFAHPAVMMRSDSVRKFTDVNGGPYSDHVLSEDWLLWSQMAVAGFRFHTMSSTGIKYRVRENSVSRVPYKEKKEEIPEIQSNFAKALGLSQPTVDSVSGGLLLPLAHWPSFRHEVSRFKLITLVRQIDAELASLGHDSKVRGLLLVRLGQIYRGIVKERRMFDRLTWVVADEASQMHLRFRNSSRETAKR